IFRALAYLHNNIGICHRDIKPQKLLVTFEETINKLQSENEWEKQNQASLELRISQLQSENSSLLEKE
ncbi:hypothetical protein S83_035491, partial [Arachis hypogaea]